jgi:hypothetical protein
MNVKMKLAAAAALAGLIMLGGCADIQLTDSQKVILGSTAAGAATGAAMGAAYGDAGLGAAAGVGAGLLGGLLYEWLVGGEALP